MGFWKAYFAVVDVLKQKVEAYERFIPFLLEHVSSEQERQEAAAAKQFEGHETIPSATPDLTESLGSLPPVEKTGSRERAPQKRNESFAGKSVLVIEPIEKNRVLIARYLDAYSLKVEFAKTESEADQKKSEAHYDGVMNTSGMDFPFEKNTLLERIKLKIANT